MKTVELLTHRLELIYQWYKGMVSPDTGMLEYLYLPQVDSFVREQSPIRNIASVWDAARLEDILQRHELRSLIEQSLRHYDAYLVPRHGYLILDPQRLNEPSSIAHSAFMILTLLYALPPQRSRQVAGLVEGVLQQQRPNGSYKVYFDELPDEGEELYAGEAMLALAEAYRRLPDPRYLQSVERGFAFYDEQHFQQNCVAEDVLVFFANWQSQACRVLFDCTRSAALKQQVTEYVYRMHDRISDQGFYKEVERHPFRQVSVEVACALEGLNDAYVLAGALHGERAERYRRQICTGLEYLLRLQCTGGGTERERGGFGLSLQERTQRIDITGHAASAFMKSVANDVECRPATP